MKSFSNFRIGCSGFSYTDWKGVFYPNSIHQSEMILYYEKFFDVLELNFSFYRMPERDQIRSFLEKTKRLEFSIKAPSLFTHERIYTAEDVERFQHALEPLVESGRFICILFQFPQSFHWNDYAREYLLKLSEDFSGVDRVIEPRNRSFLKSEVLMDLELMGFSVANVDAPRLPGLFLGPWRIVGAINYVRLHGRNSEKWYEGETSSSRYNYLYSDEDLEEIRQKLIKTFDGSVTYVFFNNHYRAKAVVNALRLKEMFGERVKFPSSLRGLMSPSLWE